MQILFLTCEGLGQSTRCCDIGQSRGRWVSVLDEGLKWLGQVSFLRCGGLGRGTRYCGMGQST
jgi:hypothetical protein